MAMIRKYGDVLDDSFAGPAVGIIVLVGLGFLYFWLAGKKRS